MWRPRHPCGPPTRRTSETARALQYWNWSLAACALDPYVRIAALHDRALTVGTDFCVVSKDQLTSTPEHSRRILPANRTGTTQVKGFAEGTTAVAPASRAIVGLGTACLRPSPFAVAPTKRRRVGVRSDLTQRLPHRLARAVVKQFASALRVQRKLKGYAPRGALVPAGPLAIPFCRIPAGKPTVRLGLPFSDASARGRSGCGSIANHVLKLFGAIRSLRDVHSPAVRRG